MRVCSSAPLVFAVAGAFLAKVEAESGLFDDDTEECSVCEWASLTCILPLPAACGGSSVCVPVPLGAISGAFRSGLGGDVQVHISTLPQG